MNKWAVAGAAVLGALIADGLLWRFGEARLADGVDRWVEDARAHGWTVSTGQRKRGGWPFAATLSIADVQVAGGERIMPGGLSWNASRLRFELAFAHPRTLLIDAPSLQHLRLSHAPEIVFTAQRLTAAVSLGRGAPAGHLHAEALSGGLTGSGHPNDVQVDAIDLGFADETARSRAPAWISARLDVAVRGLGLPDIGRWPLGAIVSAAGGTVQLDSPRLYAVSGWGSKLSSDPAEQARLWRDGGGSLTVSALSMHWGPVRLAAGASLHLDGRLQPAGNGSADVAGSAEALDALARAGVIAPGLAATGKAILAVMAHAPDDPSSVRLPFMLHDSTLSVGQIPVIRINDISWRAKDKKTVAP